MYLDYSKDFQTRVCDLFIFTQYKIIQMKVYFAQCDGKVIFIHYIHIEEIFTEIICWIHDEESLDVNSFSYLLSFTNIFSIPV